MLLDHIIARKSSVPLKLLSTSQGLVLAFPEERDPPKNANAHVNADQAAGAVDHLQHRKRGVYQCFFNPNAMVTGLCKAVTALRGGLSRSLCSKGTAVSGEALKSPAVIANRRAGNNRCCRTAKPLDTVEKIWFDGSTRTRVRPRHSSLLPAYRI